MLNWDFLIPKKSAAFSKNSLVFRLSFKTFFDLIISKKCSEKEPPLSELQIILDSSFLNF